MTKLRRILTALVIIVLGLLSVAMYVRAKQAERDALEEREAKATALLELEGFKRAHVERDPSTTSPVLAPAIKRTREAGATPAVVTHTVYETVTVEVPGACGDTPAPPLSLGAEHDFALSLTPKGDPFYLSKLFVDYSMGAAVGRVELPANEVATKVTLSKDVQDAFQLWSDRPPKFTVGIRPPSAWRIGWSVGPALVYTYDQHLTAGIAASWGAQF